MSVRMHLCAEGLTCAPSSATPGAFLLRPAQPPQPARSQMAAQSLKTRG